MAEPIICPVHRIPDCSPLLNGCGVVTWAHALVAEAVKAEGEVLLTHLLRDFKSQYAHVPADAPDDGYADLENGATTPRASRRAWTP